MTATASLLTTARSWESRPSDCLANRLVLWRFTFRLFGVPDCGRMCMIAFSDLGSITMQRSGMVLKASLSNGTLPIGLLTRSYGHEAPASLPGGKVCNDA
jgi:hypothetical protein